MHINVSSIGFKGKDEIVRRGFRDLPENYYPHTNLKYEKKNQYFNTLKISAQFYCQKEPPYPSFKGTWVLEKNFFFFPYYSHTCSIWEVPARGLSELQLGPTYTTAMATTDPEPHLRPYDGFLTHWVRPVIQLAFLRPCWVLSLLRHNGNSEKNV